VRVGTATRPPQWWLPMLNRMVVMETPLRQEECLARLESSVKPTPGYATWWAWARDKALWGSVSAEDFRVQLGRARQLTSAKGRFSGAPNGTRILMAVGFKVGRRLRHLFGSGPCRDWCRDRQGVWRKLLCSSCLGRRSVWTGIKFRSGITAAPRSNSCDWAHP